MKPNYYSTFIILSFILTFFSCKENELEIKPVADFIPLIIDFGEVTFRNKSFNATEYLWDFGDGNTSTEKDPIHSYLEIGNYNVKLTASDGTHSDEFILLIAIGQIFPENLTRLDDTPFGQRSEAVYFTHNGKGYVGGGVRHRPIFESRQDLWEFDPATKEWKMINDQLPENFRKASAFVVNDNAYLGLGAGYDFYRTNLQDEFLHFDSSIPASFFSGPVTGAVAFVHNEVPYLIGKGEYDDISSKKILKYIISQNKWVDDGDYQCSGNSGMFHFLLGDKLYIGMGNQENAFNVDNSNDVWEYNILNDSWIQKNDFPGIGRRNGISFTYNGEGYFGFGLGFDSSVSGQNYFSDLWKYNQMDDSWELVIEFPVDSKHEIYAFVLGNSLFFGGGYGNIFSTLDSFYEYKL